MLNNIQFIAQYLDAHPGSGSAAVIRALAAFKGKPYHRGLYCNYFTPTYDSYSRPGRYYFKSWTMHYGYWEKLGRGWHLTPKGRTHLLPQPPQP